MAAVDAPAAPAPQALFIYFHVAQKPQVFRGSLPRIAHRECHRRRQSWVPCGFERRPFVREKNAWILSLWFLSDEWPTGTL